MAYTYPSREEEPPRPSSLLQAENRIKTENNRRKYFINGIILVHKQKNN
jgi:hypothetical protein